MLKCYNMVIYSLRGPKFIKIAFKISFAVLHILGIE